MKKILSTLAALAIVGLAALFDIDLDALRNPAGSDGDKTATGTPQTAPRRAAKTSDTTPSSGAVAQAFAERVSDRILVDSGRVIKVLPPDNDGKPHQRFIVQVQPRLTVLVAHNLTLAPRIENLRAGDRVRFKGEYEYSAKGGVVHWTHHDPKGWREGGWVEHQGQRYE
ncbi:MAG: DUF3465 domain-containing protein [Pseudomonadota bacterium]